MVIKYSRAQRRHDYARLKKKRQYYWGYGRYGFRFADETVYMPPRTLGFLVRTAKPCSCEMCRNERNSWYSDNPLTLQERKAEDSYKEQIKDLNI